jgi:hypothetical protein
MRKDEFSTWLINIDGRDIKQKSDNVSRAGYAELAFSDYLRRSLDLDVEYQKDQCAFVLEMLSVEYIAKIPISINLPRDSRGLSSLRTAINTLSSVIKGNNSKSCRS